jgi:urea carboxylase
LSENAAFSQAAIDVGITWLGPTPSVMKTMGLKHLARAGAMESDVICVPGSTGLVSDAAALEVGYPAMLKASAAGWGMGNGDGICEDQSALWDAFAGVTKRAEVCLRTLD